MHMLGLRDTVSIACIEDFHGVRRRFEYMGKNHAGAEIYDDYAHNVGKIVSCIQTAKECGKKIIAVFQPHGFKPLELMRDSLFTALEKTLSPDDTFCFLPVYYAGGTASFSPTSEEVVSRYCADGTGRYLFFSDRANVHEYINATSSADCIILVMGARDSSLSIFASHLACGNPE
jgi:UDP-N-acetylmuramate--alanine ligase